MIVAFLHMVGETDKSTWVDVKIMVPEYGT